MRGAHLGLTSGLRFDSGHEVLDALRDQRRQRHPVRPRQEVVVSLEVAVADLHAARAPGINRVAAPRPGYAAPPRSAPAAAPATIRPR
jgi:hypothetical protein